LYIFKNYRDTRSRWQYKTDCVFYFKQER